MSEKDEMDKTLFIGWGLKKTRISHVCQHKVSVCVQIRQLILVTLKEEQSMKEIKKMVNKARDSILINQVLEGNERGEIYIIIDEEDLGDSEGEGDGKGSSNKLRSQLETIP